MGERLRNLWREIIDWKTMVMKKMSIGVKD